MLSPERERGREEDDEDDDDIFSYCVGLSIFVMLRFQSMLVSSSLSKERTTFGERWTTTLPASAHQ